MRFLASYLIASVLLVHSCLAQEEIGSADWVLPQASNERGEEGSIPVQPAYSFQLNDIFSTNETGAGDVIFANRSGLFIGPRCNVELDEQFYTPGERHPQENSLSIYTWSRCILA